MFGPGINQGKLRFRMKRIDNGIANGDGPSGGNICGIVDWMDPDEGNGLWTSVVASHAPDKTSSNFRNNERTTTTDICNAGT